MRHCTNRRGTRYHLIGEVAGVLSAPESILTSAGEWSVSGTDDTLSLADNGVYTDIGG